MSSKNANIPLTIVNLDTGDVILAQYNPKEISVDKSVPWQKAATSTGDQPEMQFTAAEGRSMSLELLFDGYEEETDIHAKYVAPLLQLAMVRNSSDDAAEEEKRPPLVSLLWPGGLPAFIGVVESVSTKYTMFLKSGRPVRATCTVKLKEASKASFKKGPSGATGSQAGA